MPRRKKTRTSRSQCRLRHSESLEQRLTLDSTVVFSEVVERRTAAVTWKGSGLGQLRLPCVPKRQVGNALFHFASFTVYPLAFFPNPVGLVMVAAQIKGRVDNREENNREYCNADRPHARLPPKIGRRRSSLAKPRRAR